MGRKDIVDRPYFSDCQRFAELVNTAVYHGEEVLLPGNLSPVRRKSPSLSSSCGELEPECYRTDLKEFFRVMQCRKDKAKLIELF